jgi:hypothetical protein
MAAVRLTEVIAALDLGTAIPGFLWQIDVLTGEITTGRVVGVNGCPWCGLGRSKKDRSVKLLREELSYLWSPIRGLSKGDAR